MAIAKTSDYWTSRISGNDPTSPVGHNNNAWAATGTASISGDYWRITNQTLAQAAVATGMTLIAGIKVTTAPSSGQAIMILDNGTHRVEVRSKGDLSKLDLVGTTTVSSADLDLDMSEDKGIPVLLRLTLSSSGTARLYMREIIEDDDATQHYLEVTGASSSSATVKWGNTNGSIDWATVYYSSKGDFSPDEMHLSDFATTSVFQTGMGIVNTLKDSNRFFLKTHVDDSSIVYGYDLSSSMISRVPLPSVHAFIATTESPDFLTLAGTRTEQKYQVIIYVTTRGSNYINAYRLGLSILGECFDELYVSTGLEGGVDTITGYDTTLDSKLDDDEVVCTHVLRVNYMKKVDMKRREV
tara:strand:- start:3572 stop:4636 length:1065 start_codon:yes stop_codon:yes gene_type:complete